MKKFSDFLSAEGRVSSIIRFGDDGISDEDVYPFAINCEYKGLDVEYESHVTDDVITEENFFPDIELVNNLMWRWLIMLCSLILAIV